MSYDIYLCEPSRAAEYGSDDVSSRDIVVKLPEKHGCNGGTYMLGGTDDAWLNVTYNYGKIYYRVFGERGIRTIYGKTGAESIPLLKGAIEQLGTDVHEDYWAATEGNARKALTHLLSFAEARPDGIWMGD